MFLLFKLHITQMGKEKSLNSGQFAGTEKNVRERGQRKIQNSDKYTN